MWLLDVNVLLYAFRADVPEHPATSAWLEAMLARKESFMVPQLVQVGFVRIATNAVFLRESAKPDEIWRFLRELCAQPGCTEHLTTPSLRARWQQLCTDHNLRANQIVDAWLAAVALQHGLTLVSHDEDFRDFHSLKVLDPILPAKLF
jgi:toxin-antitoxin system PIN domain toxin